MFSPSDQLETEAAIALQFQEELESLDFAQALPESASPDELDRIAPAMIRYLLQSGNGYVDGVDDFVERPTRANNWLYDEEEQAFKGQFIDQRPGNADRVFSFTIKKQGDDWNRVFKPVSGNFEGDD